MYTGFPSWQRRATKVALSVSWLCLAGAGTAALLNPSPAITEVIDWWRVVVAAGLVGWGIAATWSVISERYRAEWLAAWICAACLVPYVVISWATATTSGYFAGAWLFTALVAILLGRGLYCSGFAGKLRAEHEASKRHDDLSVDDD